MSSLSIVFQDGRLETQNNVSSSAVENGSCQRALLLRKEPLDCARGDNGYHVEPFDFPLNRRSGTQNNVSSSAVENGSCQRALLLTNPSTALRLRSALASRGDNGYHVEPFDCLSRWAFGNIKMSVRAQSRTGQFRESSFLEKNPSTALRLRSALASRGDKGFSSSLSIVFQDGRSGT
jgi:hypothetical protein